MKLLLSLLVVSTLPTWAVPQVLPMRAPLTAVAELVNGGPRIFSGERVRLKCSVPGKVSAEWRYQWFRGGEQLQESEYFVLWKARPQQSGKYYCQGLRTTWISTQHTLHSLPIEIEVDGGWAILQAPPLPMLVGETMTLMCRVRGNPRLTEVILYKDGVELQRQSGPELCVTNLTLQHHGSYWCRASWDGLRQTNSVISVAASVSIIEVLTEPMLEIVPNDPLIHKDRMLLVCHVQLNAREPVSHIHYYFYQDGLSLGLASSQDRVTVLRDSGRYWCKASIPTLGLKRLSEPVPYGRVTDIRTAITHPVLEEHFFYNESDRKVLLHAPDKDLMPVIRRRKRRRYRGRRSGCLGYIRDQLSHSNPELHLIQIL
ncbi:high affinity immunoglobulin gamma Fc receptor I isoform X2 [Oncorhynchus mykiss]|uniref:high affinity immunoglobulin gamma Fc receptor I isoform X2 n=1 Tax=Oncorhynchus mykiss TaxID=8022 RepID=UPI00187808D2|nr:high affinity immunoglobulin gamma Fc receptor I isoform X2 [Oncorhynchus mykiss]